MLTRQRTLPPCGRAAPSPTTIAPDENGLVLDLRDPPGELVERLVARVAQDKS